MNMIQGLIPKPSRITTLKGKFTLDNNAIISWVGDEAESTASLLAEYLRTVTGFTLPVEAGLNGTIQLQQTGETVYDEAGFCNEAYELEVDRQVHIKAETAAGLARGIQTLRQLFPAEIFSETVQNLDWSIPAVRIEDAPRLRWRGLHLDVCRHFFSVKEVCRFIDLMALHRLNMFHFHITEDQGWRIEIKKYPKLTEIGSIRKATLIGHMGDRPRKYDNTPYGGFYTQDQIREIVAFAAARHISVVPEIDMPGHMAAAITAYPGLGNTGAQLETRTIWGISSSVLNIEDSTVDFMKDVLDEVMDLFPGRFLHIGGDEAPKQEWSESQRTQERMAELDLKSEDELQSWFIKQMDNHISLRGRRLIGWSEILEGGIAPGAAVMSWLGEDGGIEAANQGHDVVMAPGHSTYFDHCQAEPFEDEPLSIGGMTTLGHTYGYEPIPKELPADKHKHVIGAQGQLWTEYIPDMKHLEYMTYPRACALAEVLWVEKDQKEYPDFLERLAVHRKRFKVMDVNAHPRP